MQAYHGSNALFDEFDTNTFGKATGLEQYGSGFYFTASEEAAGIYGNNIYDVELSLNNPYVINNEPNTKTIFLSPEEVKEIIKLHPHIYEPADNEDTPNPLGDWSERFWENCYEGSPNLKDTIDSIIDEVADKVAKSPTLFNVDMFYDNSSADKSDFLQAVKQVTGHDGIVVMNKDSNYDIYIVWEAEQIKINEVKNLEENKEKHKYSDLSK